MFNKTTKFLFLFSAFFLVVDLYMSVCCADETSFSLQEDCKCTDICIGPCPQPHPCVNCGASENSQSYELNGLRTYTFYNISSKQGYVRNNRRDVLNLFTGHNDKLLSDGGIVIGVPIHDDYGIEWCVHSDNYTCQAVANTANFVSGAFTTEEVERPVTICNWTDPILNGARGSFNFKNYGAAETTVCDHVVPEPSSSAVLKMYVDTIETPNGYYSSYSCGNKAPITIDKIGVYSCDPGELMIIKLDGSQASIYDDGTIQGELTAQEDQPAPTPTSIPDNGGKSHEIGGVLPSWAVTMLIPIAAAIVSTITGVTLKKYLKTHRCCGLGTAKPTIEVPLLEPVQDPV